jgi:hypothetical protein
MVELAELWSESALTAAVLPRYHIEMNIKRTLGQRLEGHIRCEFDPPASGSVRIERVWWPRTSISPGFIGLSIGAGEGIRTLDPDLGKVVLYP